jgi:DNA-directed RNA polymerase subunit N (RpoN/RPB10)
MEELDYEQFWPIRCTCGKVIEPVARKAWELTKSGYSLEQAHHIVGIKRNCCRRTVDSPTTVMMGPQMNRRAVEGMRILNEAPRVTGDPEDIIRNFGPAATVIRTPRTEPLQPLPPMTPSIISSPMSTAHSTEVSRGYAQQGWATLQPQQLAAPIQLTGRPAASPFPNSPFLYAPYQQQQQQQGRPAFGQFTPLQSLPTAPVSGVPTYGAQTPSFSYMQGTATPIYGGQAPVPIRGGQAIGVPVYGGQIPGVATAGMQGMAGAFQNLNLNPAGPSQLPIVPVMPTPALPPPSPIALPIRTLPIRERGGAQPTILIPQIAAGVPQDAPVRMVDVGAGFMVPISGQRRYVGF